MGTGSSGTISSPRFHSQFVYFHLQLQCLCMEFGMFCTLLCKVMFQCLFASDNCLCSSFLSLRSAPSAATDCSNPTSTLETMACILAASCARTRQASSWSIFSFRCRICSQSNVWETIKYHLVRRFCLLSASSHFDSAAARAKQIALVSSDRVSARLVVTFSSSRSLQVHHTLRHFFLYLL